MKTLVRLVLFSLVLGLFGCGSELQRTDSLTIPLPRPANGPQSASTPTTGGGQQTGRLELGRFGLTHRADRKAVRCDQLAGVPRAVRTMLSASAGTPQCGESWFSSS